MAVRRPLTLEEREEIAVGRARGEGVREIARSIGRNLSVISREVCRNRVLRRGSSSLARSAFRCWCTCDLSVSCQ
ncbi:helix-turn-helix domain-containing protein [Streptomyces yanii]|uniref:Helix-turn-helix domain-containing protein n=1 Tax=Streptomyces yanii TaxID=78510 RepID=A0ABV5R8W3_9ACTN